MKDFIYQYKWSWKVSGVLLAFVFILATVSVKPIGVSTQFVILDSIVYSAVDSSLIIEDKKAKKGYSSSNAYLNKSGGKYAKNVENPLNYSFIFVLSMIFGGYIASKMTAKKDKEDIQEVPNVVVEKFGSSINKRYIVSFIGGVLVLIGARLAGGCTSGHMMSGMMQTSVSGYLFALGAFSIAIPTAMFLYRKGE
jgi:general stress protein CsbA